MSKNISGVTYFIAVKKCVLQSRFNSLLSIFKYINPRYSGLRFTGSLIDVASDNSPKLLVTYYVLPFLFTEFDISFLQKPRKLKISFNLGILYLILHYSNHKATIFQQFHIIEVAMTSMENGWAWRNHEGTTHNRISKWLHLFCALRRVKLYLYL